MKKLNVLCIGFVVLSVCALTTATASAASRFLFEGNAIIGELSMRMEGIENILLEIMEGLGSPDILCSGIFDGAILNGGGSGTINELLMLDGTLLSETVLDLSGNEVVGDDLECVDDKEVCTGNVLVVAINMPWSWSVELDGAQYTLHILNGAESGKEPGLVFDCVFLGVLFVDLCEGLSVTLLENAEGGVLSSFTENEEISPALNCTIGGEKSLLLSGKMITTHTTGGLLTVSE